ncbi:MAG: hypothetical protein WBE26_03315 [Phycisphaerae bacterium]
MIWSKAKRVLAALAFAGIPLITTGSCNPYSGTLDFYRDDDYDDLGFFDVFIEDDYYYDDWYYDDCCYDDYYYEEIIYYP